MEAINTEFTEHLQKMGFNANFAHGFYTFANKLAGEGFTLRVDNDEFTIQNFAFIDGEQVHGEAASESVAKGIQYLEEVLNLNVQDTHQTLGPHAEVATGKEVIPSKPENKIGGIDNKCRLTQRAIDEHPGTVVALLQLQNTPEQYIKYRKGKGGKRVAYVDGQYIIMGLNYAFKFKWSFDVVDTRREQVTTTNKKGETRTDDMITVDGMLTVWMDDKEIRKTQSGSQIVREGMEIGDATKGANTDAMKKCASAFGIAMDVYSGEWSK